MQLRTLLLTLRPSIAWRLGFDIAPLDRLDADGIAGWQIGLRRACGGHRVPTGDARRLHQWMTVDLRREASRWQSMTTMLEVMCLVFQSCGDRAQPLHPDLLLRWSMNATAALTRLGATYHPRPVEIGLAERLHELLAQHPDACDLRCRLDRFAAATPAANHPPASGLWEPTDTRTRAVMQKLLAEGRPTPQRS